MGSPRVHLPVGARLNAIKRLVFTPCSDKFYVFVETLFPAIGHGLWMLLVPSPTQIVQNYLRPKLGRRGSRFPKIPGSKTFARLTGRKYRVFPGGFPDVDEIIADKLPGRGALAGRVAGSLEKWLWVGIDVSDFIGWYFLLYEVGNEGSIIWASNIMGAEFCNNKSKLTGAWDKFSCPATDASAWSTGGEFWLDNVHNCDFEASGVFGPEDHGICKGGTFAWSLRWVGFGYCTFGPMRLQLWNGVTKVLDEEQGSAVTVQIAEHGEIEINASWDYPGAWDRGQLSIGAGNGTGYVCEKFFSAGLLYGYENGLNT